MFLMPCPVCPSPARGATGWLGLLLGSRLYFRVTADVLADGARYEAVVDDIVQEVRRRAPLARASAAGAARGGEGEQAGLHVAPRGSAPPAAAERAARAEGGGRRRAAWPHAAGGGGRRREDDEGERKFRTIRMQGESLDAGPPTPRDRRRLEAQTPAAREAILTAGTTVARCWILWTS